MAEKNINKKPSSNVTYPRHAYSFTDDGASTLSSRAINFTWPISFIATTYSASLDMQFGDIVMDTKYLQDGGATDMFKILATCSSLRTLTVRYTGIPLNGDGKLCTAEEVANDPDFTQALGA
jgi:hypothetical protein